MTCHTTSRVRTIEAAFATHHGRVGQQCIADAVGFASHAQISRRITQVATGDADGLLSAYTGLQAFRLILSDGALRATVHAVTAAPDEVVIDPAASLFETMTQAGRLIAEASADMSPSSEGGTALSHAERQRLDGILCALQLQVEAARRGLACQA